MSFKVPIITSLSIPRVEELQGATLYNLDKSLLHHLAVLSNYPERYSAEVTKQLNILKEIVYSNSFILPLLRRTEEKGIKQQASIYYLLDPEEVARITSFLPGTTIQGRGIISLQQEKKIIKGTSYTIIVPVGTKYLPILIDGSFFVLSNEGSNVTLLYQPSRFNTMLEDIVAAEEIQNRLYQTLGYRLPSTVSYYESLIIDYALDLTKTSDFATAADILSFFGIVQPVVKGTIDDYLVRKNISIWRQKKYGLYSPYLY